MAYQEDIALMAHLMRRAGFGATRDELETRVAKGYENTVEELLHPETQPPVDAYELLRYQPASLLPGGQPPMGNVNWMYYLVNTKRPLEEKMALFWHHVFATGNSKVDNYDQLLEQIELLRENGMGNYREMLSKISRNPTIMFWLDNQQNHRTAVNENWGRELLELFSLGAGNYTETDVRECSRAFTGWTFETKILRAIFNSDFFKEARFQHVKSPAEVVVSTLRFVGGYELPKPGYGELSMHTAYMGQDLLNPPSVEGWHTGKEWINSGSLMARINFMAEKIGNTEAPGVRGIIDRLKTRGSLTPEQLVDGCLDLLGPVEVNPDTKEQLLSQANEWGQISWSNGGSHASD